MTPLPLATSGAGSVPAPDNPHGSFYIPSLDGIRGAACLVVFFGHALPLPFSRAFPAAFGVLTFFLLSGYLITTLLRREFAATGNVNLRHFYLRRVLRILPPFYLVLVLTTVLTLLGLLEGRAEVSTILAYSLHIANYWHIWHGVENIPGGTSVYWSLSVEEHFYLVFPVLFWFASSRKAQLKQLLWGIAGICLAVMLWRIYLVLDGATYERVYRATDTRIDTILVGCALGLYKNPMLDPRADSGKAWLYWGLPFGIALLAASFVIRMVVLHDAVRWTLQAVALIPIFVAAIRFPNWGPFWLLNTRIARFFGLISFTLYLVHVPILHLLAHNTSWSWPIRTAIALPSSILLSYVVQIVIEAPCARLRRQLTTRKPRGTSKGPGSQNQDTGLANPVA